MYKMLDILCASQCIPILSDVTEIENFRIKILRPVNKPLMSKRVINR